MLSRSKFSAVLLVLVVAAAAPGGHVPPALDVPVLWTPLPGSGYLDFMTPAAFIPVAGLPPGGIFREEHTGYTLAPPAGNAFGLDIIDDPFDNDVWAGDRADFDWVQEHRPHETGGGPSNHPGAGALGWTSGVTSPSPHTTGGAPHGHSVAEVPPGPLPELILPDFAGPLIRVVDVFSIVSIQQDLDADPAGNFSPRDAALDYDLWFVNLAAGIAVPGTPIMVFAPGWTLASGSDDWVARWVPGAPPPPGVPGFDAIAIDPSTANFGHDEISEIDAVVAVPEPGAVVLLGLGLFGVTRRRST